MLTLKQHDLLTFIKYYMEQNTIAPSLEEMREAVGLLSKSGIHRLLTQLEERGFIRRLYGRTRAIKLTPPVTLQTGLLKLRGEIDCRIQHGAESGGHLEYVLSELDNIITALKP